MLFMLAARWETTSERKIERIAADNGTTSTGHSDPERQRQEETARAGQHPYCHRGEAGIARQTIEPEKRAIAVAWLFHLAGDIHQPLHTVQLFTWEYPNGDGGGNEVCVRVAPGRAAINLHRLWDGLITSTNNVGQLSKIATELHTKFSRVAMRELDSSAPEAWAKESYEIATKIAYEGGSLRGTPKGSARDCREVRDADF